MFDPAKPLCVEVRGVAVEFRPLTAGDYARFCQRAAESRKKGDLVAPDFDLVHISARRPESGSPLFESPLAVEALDRGAFGELLAHALEANGLGDPQAKKPKSRATPPPA